MTIQEFEQFLAEEIKQVNTLGNVITAQDEKDLRDGCEHLLKDGHSAEQLKQEVLVYIKDMQAAYDLEQQTKQFLIMTQKRAAEGLLRNAKRLQRGEVVLNDADTTALEELCRKVREIEQGEEIGDSTGMVFGVRL